MVLRTSTLAFLDLSSAGTFFGVCGDLRFREIFLGALVSPSDGIGIVAAVFDVAWFVGGCSELVSFSMGLLSSV